MHCIASSRLFELLPFKSPSTYPTQFLTVLEIELFCNLIGTKVTPLDSLNRFSRSFYSCYNNNELCARLKYEDIIYFFPEKKKFFPPSLTFLFLRPARTKTIFSTQIGGKTIIPNFVRIRLKKKMTQK
jgi:hypothetical protein